MKKKMRKAIRLLMVLVIVIFLLYLIGGWSTGDVQYLLGKTFEKLKMTQAAISLYSKASDKNFQEAQCQLGNIYYYGEGVEKDYEKAFKCFQKTLGREFPRGSRYYSALRNHTEVFNKLGEMYAKGKGTEKCLDSAVFYFMNFIKQRKLEWEWNNEENFYESNNYLFPSNYVDFSGLFKSNSLGLESESEKLEWIKECVSRKDPEAFFKLGRLYSSGHLVEKDSRKALKLFNEGLNILYDPYKVVGSGGFLFTKQDISNMNDKEVDDLLQFLWIKYKALKDDAKAQLWIGEKYLHGKIISQDYETAFEYFTKAATQKKQGAQFYYEAISDARFYLGQMCENGQGVIEDFVKAYKWYILAGLIGSKNTDAVKAKNQLREKMTPEQLQRAQNLAKSFVGR